MRGPETSCHLSISHPCNLLSHCYNLLSNLCISLPRFCMPFFTACCQVVGHVHVLSHISFLTPSIIPLYSCIDVHVCGEMKQQPVHVFYEDAGGANIGHVTTVSTDGKGEGGGGGRNQMVQPQCGRYTLLHPAE